MLRPQVILFPTIVVIVLVLISLTGMLSDPAVVEASSQVANATPDDSTSLAGLVATNGAVTNNSSQVQDCDLPARYPQSIRRWCGLIYTYAQKQSLDPRLVAAVMLQESGGDPEAYSGSGAVGLLQVMPRDGLAASFTCSGKPCFSSRPSIAELLDPEFNISYGTRMLAGLVEKYGGLRQGLKAYGPMDYGFVYADKVLSIFENYR